MSTRPEVEFGSVAGGFDLASNFRPLSGAFLDEFKTLIPAIRPQKVTVLPANAGAGDEVYFQTDTSGVTYWHLAYLPDGSAYPWKFLGGAYMHSAVETTETTVSTTYTNLATTGPQLVAPLPGDYELRYGATMTGTATDILLASIWRTVIGIADTEAVEVAIANPAAATSGSSPSRSKLFFGVAAQDTLLMQYRTVVGSTGSFSRRWMSLQPVRVAAA